MMMMMMMMMIMTVNIGTANFLSFAYINRGSSYEILSLQEYTVIMHWLFFFIAVLSTFQAVNADQSIWNLFKRIHKKQYINAREEQYR
jgi:Na+/H+-dicarboxylate symporter